VAAARRPPRLRPTLLGTYAGLFDPANDSEMASSNFSFVPASRICTFTTPLTWRGTAIKPGPT